MTNKIKQKMPPKLNATLTHDKNSNPWMAPKFFFVLNIDFTFRYLFQPKKIFFPHIPRGNQKMDILKCKECEY